MSKNTTTKTIRVDAADMSAADEHLLQMAKHSVQFLQAHSATPKEAFDILLNTFHMIVVLCISETEPDYLEERKKTFKNFAQDINDAAELLR